jgi:hypothetical protein
LFLLCNSSGGSQPQSMEIHAPILKLNIVLSLGISLTILSHAPSPSKSSSRYLGFCDSTGPILAGLVQKMKVNHGLEVLNPAHPPNSERAKGGP